MSVTLENTRVAFGWLSSYTARSLDKFIVHTEPEPL